MSNESLNLLPCPFCGDEVELVNSRVAGHGDWIRHKTHTCGFDVTGADVDDLPTAWNTRATVKRGEISVIDEGKLDRLLNAYESKCIKYGLGNHNTDALQDARKEVVQYINTLPKREIGKDNG